MGGMNRICDFQWKASKHHISNATPWIRDFYVYNIPTDALVLMIRFSTTSSSSIQIQLRLEVRSAIKIIWSSKSLNGLPFNLVPIGSPALFINTQALSSNFTTLPSGLCNFFAVLTTTACLRSPLRTLFAADVETLAPGPDSVKFRCFCTTTIIRSPVQVRAKQYFDLESWGVPIFACLFILITFTHSTTAAPELSMQFSIVLIKIST